MLNVHCPFLRPYFVTHFIGKIHIQTHTMIMKMMKLIGLVEEEEFVKPTQGTRLPHILQHVTLHRQ